MAGPAEAAAALIGMIFCLFAAWSCTLLGAISGRIGLGQMDHDTRVGRGALALNAWACILGSVGLALFFRARDVLSYRGNGPPPLPLFLFVSGGTAGALAALFVYRNTPALRSTAWALAAVGLVTALLSLGALPHGANDIEPWYTLVLFFHYTLIYSAATAVAAGVLAGLLLTSLPRPVQCLSPMRPMAAQSFGTGAALSLLGLYHWWQWDSQYPWFAPALLLCSLAIAIVATIGSRLHQGIIIKVVSPSSSNTALLVMGLLLVGLAIVAFLSAIVAWRNSSVPLQELNAQLLAELTLAAWFALLAMFCGWLRVRRLPTGLSRAILTMAIMVLIGCSLARAFVWLLR
jgi:hypothetical protein